MKIDLHLHTNFSDGILEPQSLIELAHSRGVAILSITDHDCVEAIPIAEKKAKSLGMTLVNGVELNTDGREGEIHILGYNFDRENEALLEKMSIQRQFRRERFKKMLEKLKSLGFNLEEKRVIEIAGKGSVGRPHLALALIEKNYVQTVDEAFKHYLGFGKPAWVPRNRFTAQEAIAVIRDAGGIAVLAHPVRGGKAQLNDLVKHGLEGIEVYYPTHSPNDVSECEALAVKHKLLMTAGSDYHGINQAERGPGGVRAPQEVIDALERIFNANVNQ